MTVTATLALSAVAARTLADAVSADEAISATAVDAEEIAPDRWRVTIYFDHADAPLRAAVGVLIAQTTGDAAAAEWQTLSDTDWVRASQAARPAVRAGRFLVHGAHERDKVKPNDLAIAIEAAQAFGTGHHGTTRGCLLAIERAVKTRRISSALDIGTGSGVLAIALAKLGVPTLATDIDPVAVAIAHDNAQANGTGSRVRVVPMPGIAGRLPRGGAPRGYDLIVANILLAPLLSLAPAIARALAPGGVAILSGLTPDQRRRIVASYRGLRLVPVRSTVLDGWLTVAMTRPNHGHVGGSRRVR